MLPLIAARIDVLRGVFPFDPFMFEMRWTSFGIRASKRFSAKAGAEEECLTMLSKHSLSNLIPNLGTPMMAVSKNKQMCGNLG